MCMFANEVQQVVTEKTQRGEMFTAFDVTKAVREMVNASDRAAGNPRQNIPHNEVKQEVHYLFSNGQMGPDYVRNLGNLPLAPGIDQPYIYHRNTDDHTAYGSGIPQLAVTPAQAISGGTAPDPDGGDDGVNKTADGTYKVDARETLCVPKSLLSGCGLNSGDEAYVSADPLAGCIVVSKSPPDATVLTQLSTYTVDKYGNVRITQFALQKGGVGGKEFDIEGDGTKVYVRKA